jgi:hypothetical protein
MNRGEPDWLALADGLDPRGLWGWVRWQSSTVDAADAVDKLTEQIKAWRRELR